MKPLQQRLEEATEWLVTEWWDAPRPLPENLADKFCLSPEQALQVMRDAFAIRQKSPRTKQSTWGRADVV